LNLFNLIDSIFLEFIFRSSQFCQTADTQLLRHLKVVLILAPVKMQNEDELTPEEVRGFAYLEVNGVNAALAKAALALHQANPKPENVFTFMADEMTRARATNNIFPELRRFAAERNEFLAYAATTKLAEALDLTFNALLESEPMTLLPSWLNI
jgi:hypothetical protein